MDKRLLKSAKEQSVRSKNSHKWLKKVIGLFLHLSLHCGAIFATPIPSSLGVFFYMLYKAFAIYCTYGGGETPHLPRCLTQIPTQNRKNAGGGNGAKGCGEHYAPGPKRPKSAGKSSRRCRIAAHNPEVEGSSPTAVTRTPLISYEISGVSSLLCPISCGKKSGSTPDPYGK